MLARLWQPRHGQVDRLLTEPRESTVVVGKHADVGEGPGGPYRRRRPFEAAEILRQRHFCLAAGY